MFGSQKATRGDAPVRHSSWRNSVSLAALIVAAGLGVTLAPASAQQQGGDGGDFYTGIGGLGGTAGQPGVDGGAATSPGYGGAGGGGGGSGLIFGSKPSGGAGGNGYNGGTGGAAEQNGQDVSGADQGGGGGGGGNGGAPIDVRSAGATSFSGVFFSAGGGNGGNGGSATGSASDGGSGGGGGAGGHNAIFGGAGSYTVNIISTTTINGGTGGAGGNGGNGNATVGTSVGGDGGSGGRGGNALLITAPGVTLNNEGTLIGGNGGVGGTGGTGASQNGYDGQAGRGGAAVVGGDLTVVNNGLISGGMSGDGLSQANAITFTGGANRLTIGTTGDFSGNIAIRGNGSLTLDQSANDAAIYSDITGSGSLIKTGSATVLLAGFNTYSGGTTVTQGTLELDGPQPLGVGVVTMNGGTLRVSSCGCGGGAVLLYNDVTITARGGTFDAGSGILAFAGNITGGTDDSVLTITGAGGPFPGFVAFAGYNTYRGWTHITADGVLLAVSPTALSPNSNYIVDGILDIGGFDTTIGGLSGASTGQVGSTGFGPVTLTLGTPAGTSVYNGIILDGGPDPVSVVKTGPGKQVLAGINAYTGSTTVNEGILAIDGSITASSGVTVNSGGTLGGNGTVGNTIINAGGTLAPGNSIGTLTVQGNLTFMSGSTYQVEVSPAGADRVNVSGIATLNGATLSAIYEPGAYVSKRYTVLNAAGSVKGTFAGPVNTNLPTNFSAKVDYDPNNVYLDLTLNYVPPQPPYFGNGLTVNQTQVANALVNSFNTAGGIPLVFGALTPMGLTQASGESATGVQQSTIDVMDRFVNLMTDPYASGRTTAAVPMSYAPLPKGTPPIVATVPHRWSVWAAGYGGTQTTHGNGFIGSNTYTGGIYGFAAGADYRVAPDTVLGFALGGAGTSYHLANGLGSGSSNVFQLGIYGRQNFGAAYVAGSLAYGWQDVTTDRRVQFDQLRARFNANAFSGRLEGGYRFGTPFGGLTPYAAGQFTHVALPAYREQSITGPGLFALSYGSKSVTAWRTELGARADTSFDMGGAMLTLRGRLAWAHNFNPDRSLSAAFLSLPASGFVVNGAAPSRNAALVSAGAEMKWASGWSVAASFEGEFSGRRNSYAGKGALRYQW